MSIQPRILEVRQNVLKHNDEVARGLREQFRNAGVFVVSLVSSPGSGKTAFLEKTLAQEHVTVVGGLLVAAILGHLKGE